MGVSASISSAQDDGSIRDANGLKSWLRCWETGDVKRYEQSLHPQVRFAYPGGRLTFSELRSTFAAYASAKKDVRLTFGRCLWSGDRFALEYQFAATDRTTGVRQAIGSAAIGKLKDGKILLYREYYDEHVAERQARGEIPLDEGEVFPYPASILLQPQLIN